ncbi:MAG: hypothetical protein Q9221_003543 [Calogaya cf. arnoldii]
MSQLVTLAKLDGEKPKYQSQKDDNIGVLIRRNWGPNHSYWIVDAKNGDRRIVVFDTAILPSSHLRNGLVDLAISPSNEEIIASSPRLEAQDLDLEGGDMGATGNATAGAVHEKGPESSTGKGKKRAREVSRGEDELEKLEYRLQCVREEEADLVRRIEAAKQAAKGASMG